MTAVLSGRDLEIAVAKALGAWGDTITNTRYLTDPTAFATVLAALIEADCGFEIQCPPRRMASPQVRLMTPMTWLLQGETLQEAVCRALVALKGEAQ